MNGLRLHAAAVALAVTAALAAGCTGPDVWEGFEQIELGKPLPTELPEGMQRTHLGAAYIGSIDADAHGNLDDDMRVMNALTDEAGNVIAKSVLDVKMAHRILFVACEYKFAIELDIPAEAFAVPVKKWKAPEELRGLALVSEQLGATIIQSRPEPTSAPADGEESKELVHTLANVRNGLNGCLIDLRNGEKTVTEATEKSLAQQESPGWVDRLMTAHVHAFFFAMGIHGRMEAMAEPMAAAETTEYPLANVSEALLYHKLLLNVAARPREQADYDGTSVPLVMYMDAAASRVLDLLSDRGAFSEVAEEGSNRFKGTLDGMSIRVRNLGGRRVRVEVGGFLIRDPIIAPLTLLN